MITKSFFLHGTIFINITKYKRWQMFAIPKSISKFKHWQMDKTPVLKAITSSFHSPPGHNEHHCYISKHRYWHFAKQSTRIVLSKYTIPIRESIHITWQLTRHLNRGSLSPQYGMLTPMPTSLSQWTIWQFSDLMEELRHYKSNICFHWQTKTSIPVFFTRFD